MFPLQWVYKQILLLEDTMVKKAHFHILWVSWWKLSSSQPKCKKCFSWFDTKWFCRLHSVLFCFPKQIHFHMLILFLLSPWENVDNIFLSLKFYCSFYIVFLYKQAFIITLKKKKRFYWRYILDPQIKSVKQKIQSSII